VTTAADLVGGVWFPALDPNIAVNIQTATEHDGGSPSDTYGDIRLVEFGDGDTQYILDELSDGVIAGQRIEIRRGLVDGRCTVVARIEYRYANQRKVLGVASGPYFDSPAFEDMEVWCRTEGDSLAWDGRILTIAQRSRFSLFRLEPNGEQERLH